MRPLKTEYSKRLELVRRAIQKQDPLGLLRHGAPADEYDSEAQRILVVAVKCANAEALQQGIYQIFVESFGQETAGPSESYSALAREIYDALGSHD